MAMALLRRLLSNLIPQSDHAEFAGAVSVVLMATVFFIWTVGGWMPGMTALLVSGGELGGMPAAS